MTEPVQGVIKTGVVERRTATQERLRRQHGSSHNHHKDEIEADDSVDISEEARQRAGGTYHKTILEHLEECDDNAPSK